MIKVSGYTFIIVCDKCHKVIREGLEMTTQEHLKKLINKKKFCGECIQARLNRNKKRRTKMSPEQLSATAVACTILAVFIIIMIVRS